jgi:hypothetical protein
MYIYIDDVVVYSHTNNSIMRDKQYKKACKFLSLMIKNDNQNVKKHMMSEMLDANISNVNIHNFITQVARILYTHTGIQLYQIRKKSLIYLDKDTALEFNLMPPPFDAILVPLSREIRMKSYFLEKRMEIMGYLKLKKPKTIEKVEDEYPCYITDFITFYESENDSEKVVEKIELNQDKMNNILDYSEKVVEKIELNQDVMIDVIDNIRGYKQIVSVKDFLDYSRF